MTATNSEQSMDLNRLTSEVNKVAVAKSDPVEPQIKVPSVPYAPHPLFWKFLAAAAIALLGGLAAFILRVPGNEIVEGRIVPVHIKQVTAPVSGRFSLNPSIFVGAIVHPGVSVGSMENRALAVELAQRKAEEVAAAAGIETLRDIVEAHSQLLASAKLLRARNTISQIELHRAESAFQEARLRLTLMEAEARRTRSNIDPLSESMKWQQLRSSMSGMVLEIRKDLDGAFVNEGVSLMQIGSRELQFELKIPEALLRAGFAVGGEVEIRVSATDQAFRGVIAKVLPQIHDSVNGPYRRPEAYGTVIVDVREVLPSSLRPGMHVKAHLVHAKPRLLQWWERAAGTVSTIAGFGRRSDR